MDLSRRTVLRILVALPWVGPLLGELACGGSAGGAAATAGFLSPRERTTLDAVLSVMIPTDAQPGAHEARVVDYVDGLLGAFATSPPRIFAGGPFSGRHGGADGFDHFVPLTRMEELAWRTRIEGSRGRAEREWNGPVQGYQQIYREGLAALEDAAVAQTGLSYAELDVSQRTSILRAADEGFRKLLYQHACEGMYGDPVYGGNAGFVGWTNIHYEGDRQPIGYTRQQMEEVDPS